MCVFVCVYICICLCIYVCIHTYICVCGCLCACLDILPICSLLHPQHDFFSCGRFLPSPGGYAARIQHSYHIYIHVYRHNCNHARFGWVNPNPNPNTVRSLYIHLYRHIYSSARFFLAAGVFSIARRLRSACSTQCCISLYLYLSTLFGLNRTWLCIAICISIDISIAPHDFFSRARFLPSPGGYAS